eukprot:2785029-Pleurochrysis_carterae.AAC.7
MCPPERCTADNRQEAGHKQQSQTALADQGLRRCGRARLPASCCFRMNDRTGSPERTSETRTQASAQEGRHLQAQAAAGRGGFTARSRETTTGYTVGH